MAIVRDTSGGSSSTDVSSKTNAITVGNNANRRLTVVVSSNGASGQVAVSGITYNGVAMTKQLHLGSNQASDNRIEIWELVAPSTGTNNLIVTMAAMCDFLDIGWVSLYNASQSITPDSTNSGNTVSQNASVTTASVSDNSWAVSIGYPIDNPSQSITGATEFQGGFFPDAGYSGPKTPAGTITHTYNGLASGEKWVWGIVSIEPAERSISVSNTVTLFESVNRILESNVNKSDSITITEAVSVAINTTLGINVSDSVTASESVGRMEENNRLVSDSITITENVARVLESFINKNESITLTENTITQIPNLGDMAKSESISVSEALGLQQESYISKSDQVSISDTPNVNLVNLIAVSEGITLSENVSATIALQAAVSDDITLDDQVSTTHTLNIGVNDQISTTEAVSTDQSISISSNESINLTEAINAATVNTIGVSDNVTLSESQNVSTVLNIQQSETITITENQDQIFPFLSVNVTENVTLTEQVIFQSEYLKNQPYYMDIGSGLSMMLGAPRMAVWGTNGRPQTPRLGEYGINDELLQIEIWNGSEWRKIATTSL